MFKVGDEVIGTCSWGHPYTTTCAGWKGTVIKIISDGSQWGNEDIVVRAKVIDQYSSDYPVESKHFRLLKSKYTRNLPAWW